MPIPEKVASSDKEKIEFLRAIKDGLSKNSQISEQAYLALMQICFRKKSVPSKVPSVDTIQKQIKDCILLSNSSQQMDSRATQ